MEQNNTNLEEENLRLTKFLLASEWVIGYTSVALFITLLLVAILVPMAWYYVLLLIALSIISFAVGMYFCLKIEQTAGYYKCKICGHKHKPKFTSILLSMHYGRTRFMHCDKCNKLTWQNKVIK